MMQPDLRIEPMRRELVDLGFRELRTRSEVDAFMEASKVGTALVAVNSVCGCAAGSLRPALARALGHENRPAALATVFAGQDVESTERAREYFNGRPPSSPAVALFRDGELVLMLERHQIQGRPPQMIADDLVRAFDTHCRAGAAR